MMWRIGPRTDPWGTPLVTGTDSDSSPSIMTFCDRPDRKDFTPMMWRIGPRTDPWGTPLVTGTDSDSSPSIMTFCDRPDRKDVALIDGIVGR